MLLLIALTCFSVPVFQAGFFNDDAVWSVWASQKEVQHKSYWTFANANLIEMISSQGRMAVLYAFVVMPSQMAIGDNLPLYHMWQLTLWGVALWSALSLASSLGGGRSSVLLLAVILSLMQFTDYHNPVLSYLFFIPIILISGAWTIIFYLRGITEGKRIYTWLWAPAVYFLGLLSASEFMLCFFAIVCGVALIGPLPLKKRILALFPLAGITLLFVSLNLWLRSHYSIVYSGTQLGSISTAGLTYIIQLVSVIPFSYLYLNPLGNMTNWQSDISLSQLAVALSGGACICLLVYRGLTESLEMGHSGRRRMSLAGVILLFLPPLLTAVSKKYQNELHWGYGYMQVAFQVIGCAFLAITFMAWLAGVTIHRRKLYIQTSIFTALFTGLFFAGLSVSNQVAVARLNAYHLTPRNLCKTILQHYPFPENQQGGPTLVVDAPWLNRWEIWEFYYQHTARRFSVTTWNDYTSRGAQSQKGSPDQLSEVYYISSPRKMSNNDGSVMIFGKLSSISPSPSKDSDWILSQVVIAARSNVDTQYTLVNQSAANIPLIKIYSSEGFLREPCTLYSTTGSIPLDRSFVATPTILRLP